MADAALQSPASEPQAVDDSEIVSDPGSTKNRRKRRTKEEIEAERQFKMRFKRKRGRPTRDEVEERRKMLLEAGISVPDPVAGNSRGQNDAGGSGNAVFGSSPDVSGLRKVQKKKDSPVPTPGVLLGKTVHGVFDGSFDAGYFLTVKVADTDMVFRGVVFGPARAVPVTNSNDIVPGVRTIARQDIPMPTTMTRSLAQASVQGEAALASPLTTIPTAAAVKPSPL